MIHTLGLGDVSQVVEHDRRRHPVEDRHDLDDLSGRFSVPPTLLLSMCRRVVSNVSRSFCGTIWPWTRKGLPAALVPVPIPRASFMPPLERTISATPATHGRPRRCRLPACP